MLSSAIFSRHILLPDLACTGASILVRIPTKAITNSDLSRSAIRRHADHARSEATLADEILTEVIGIRQRMR